MKYSKILILLVILMTGIAFSGCIGNSGNDQNATEETTPTVSEDSANATENPSTLEKASLNESEENGSAESSSGFIDSMKDTTQNPHNIENWNNYNIRNHRKVILMKILKILTLLVILMAGIAFSGCIGNLGNDQNAIEETTQTVTEDSANATENPNDLEKASLNESETMTTPASEFSGRYI